MCVCVWQRPRIRDFWERVLNEEFTDDLWIRHFRLTRATFNDLRDALAPLVAVDLPCPRDPVPTQERVAIDRT